jgi:hypothetical protein
VSRWSVCDERQVNTGLRYRPADWPRLTAYQCSSHCPCSAARMATAARSPAIRNATARVHTHLPTPAPSRISQRSPLVEIASGQLSRRSLLVATGSLAAAAALPTFLAGCTPGERKSSMPTGLDFDPIAPVPEKVDAMTVPDGYRWTLILRWGDPLFADSPDRIASGRKYTIGAPARSNLLAVAHSVGFSSLPADHRQRRQCVLPIMPLAASLWRMLIIGIIMLGGQSPGRQ